MSKEKKEIDYELRERLQKKSKEIGHCVCNDQVQCPCPDFIENDICRCAGEDGGWRSQKVEYE